MSLCDPDGITYDMGMAYSSSQDLEDDTVFERAFVLTTGETAAEATLEWTSGGADICGASWDLWMSPAFFDCVVPGGPDLPEEDLSF